MFSYFWNPRNLFYSYSWLEASVIGKKLNSCCQGCQFCFLESCRAAGKRGPQRRLLSGSHQQEEPRPACPDHVLRHNRLQLRNQEYSGRGESDLLSRADESWWNAGSLPITTVFSLHWIKNCVYLRFLYRFTIAHWSHFYQKMKIKFSWLIKRLLRLCKDKIKAV